MLSSDTVNTVADDSGDRTVSRKEQLQALRDARGAARREAYEIRKLAKQCTRCGKPLSVKLLDAGKQECKRCGWVKRRAQKRAMRRLRATREKSKRCRNCNRPSRDRRTCLVCVVAMGKLPVERASRAGDRTVSGTRISTTESDGYTRSRFVGQARRGAPSRETEDRWDLQSAKTSMERAFEGYAVAGDPENGLSDADRVEARRAARGHLDLAIRFGEEILERNRDERDERQQNRQVQRIRAKMGR